MTWFAVVGELETYLLTATAIIGLMVASNLLLGPCWCAFVAALVGLSLGMDSSQEKLSRQEKFVSFFGTGLGLFFLLLFPMGITDYLSEKNHGT